MCMVCYRNPYRDGWGPGQPEDKEEEKEEEEEEDDDGEWQPAPRPPPRPMQKTVVQPAPSHDGATTFAAYCVPETTPETEAELRPFRPPFGIIIYDTTHTARPARSARLARALFDRTFEYRSKSPNEPDRIEVVTLPLPESFSNDERVDACVRHHEQEIQSRLVMADKAEAASWFLPERIMDRAYSRKILAINHFNEDVGDGVEVAPWELSLAAPDDAMENEESHYGSYLDISWLPRKELWAQADQPGYTAKKCVCWSQMGFEGFQQSFWVMVDAISPFYYHFVGHGVLDQQLEKAREG